jgi:hypothetical protein
LASKHKNGKLWVLLSRHGEEAVQVVVVVVVGQRTLGDGRELWV